MYKAVSPVTMVGYRTTHKFSGFHITYNDQLEPVMGEWKAQSQAAIPHNALW